MKGKFRYHFANGSSMVDRNGYKTLSGAKAWAHGHNLSPKTRKTEKVVKITMVKRKKN